VYISGPKEGLNIKMLLFSTERQTTHSYMYISLPTDRLYPAMCKFQFWQAERIQHFIEFGNDRQSTHHNMYSSELTEGPYTTMCNVQYRQSGHTQQCVKSVPTDKLHKAMCKFQYRNLDHTKQYLYFSNDRLPTHINV